MIEDPGLGVEIRRVHEVLRRHFRRAGFGSIRRVEKALGICDGSFRQWRRRRRLELRYLYRALAEIGVEPAAFWAEVAGVGFDRVALASRPAARPRDPVVRRALKRWQEPGAEAAARRGDEELRRLDALRDEDPGRAVKESKAALARAARAEIPQLLAIYGSARRVEARIDQALEALGHAGALAGRRDPRLHADILQRLGVAHAYAGDHALGLLFAREAAQVFRLAGDAAGEGRCLVDQGSRYCHLGRLDDGIAAYRAALRCLPASEAGNRFGACQSLAVALRKAGSPAEALDYVRRAEELAPRVGPSLSALLLATKAEILLSQQDYREAERCYGEVCRLYRPLSPIDAALAAVDLVRAQMLGGRLGPALETVKSLAAFLQPLAKNRLASEAIRRLVRMALTGEAITLEMLERVGRAIEKARARPGGRARPRP